MLDEMVPAAKPKDKPKKPVRDVYRRARGEDEGGSYRTI
jgi:hypothetical protein